jgi:hypothetical protein
VWTVFNPRSGSSSVQLMSMMVGNIPGTIFVLVCLHFLFRLAVLLIHASLISRKRIQG